MSAVSIGRILLVVCSVLLLSIALALTTIAVATPNWQVVYLAEFHAEHLHGLWLDCTITNYYQQAYVANDAIHCTYKFENPNMYPDYGAGAAAIHGEEIQHKFHDWHKVTLTLFAIAILCGCSAFCFSLCAICVRICSIVANVLTLCAFMSSMLAVFVFFIKSHRTDIRFVHGVTMTYEQEKGYSFYLSVVGVILFLMAFCVGIMGTILVFIHGKGRHRRSSNQQPAIYTTHQHLQQSKRSKTFPTETATIASIAV